MRFFKKRRLKPVYVPLLLWGVQTQGSRSEGKGAIWRRRGSLDQGELLNWPSLGTKHNLFDLEGTLFQNMRDRTAMHSGEKGRLHLFIIPFRAGWVDCKWSLPTSHDWTGRGGSPGEGWGGRRLPSVQAADEVLLVCVCCNPWAVCQNPEQVWHKKPQIFLIIQKSLGLAH